MEPDGVLNMSMTLYGAPLSPFVRKVEVVLREKTIPFESEPVNILPMPDWFKKISPAQRIPVLRDCSVGKEGTSGTLPDSSAICAYLEKHTPDPAIYPSDPFEFGRALWLEEYADSELGLRMGMGLFRPLVFPMFSGKEPDIETARKTWNETLPRFFDYYEGELDGAEHLAGGALSIADIAVTCQLTQIELVAGPIDAKQWPALSALFERVKNRPSFAENLRICRKIVKQPFDLSQ